MRVRLGWIGHNTPVQNVANMPVSEVDASVFNNNDLETEKSGAELVDVDVKDAKCRTKAALGNPNRNTQTKKTNNSAHSGSDEGPAENEHFWKHRAFWYGSVLHPWWSA